MGTKIALAKVDLTQIRKAKTRKILMIDLIPIKLQNNSLQK
jgi:hypothetical protein